MGLGEKLKAIRKNKHALTLNEVANRTGLSVSFLSDIERGRTKPSLSTLETLANFYGVNISELMDNKNQDPISDLEILPAGLRDLLEEENNIDPDVIRAMVLLQHRSKNKLVNKEDWKMYYQSLKFMLKL